MILLVYNPSSEKNYRIYPNWVNYKPSIGYLLERRLVDYFEQQFVKNLTRPLSDCDDSKNSFGQYRLSFDRIRNRNIL